MAPWLALALGSGQSDLSQLLHKLGDLPPGPVRTARASALLLGRPYALHPLGEGEGQDPKPRLWLDGFDCQTFVEPALALGQARTEAEVRAAMDDLRYAGAPSFAERNHFMMSQWVPSNVAKGYLAAPESADGVAEKVITDASWRARSVKEIELPQARIPLGRFTLPLTTLETLLATAATLPSGTVMLVVRADRPRFPDRVTHLGFVIQRGGHTYFRHASDVFKHVVDEALEHFVARNQRYAYTVSGVSLLTVQAAGDRVRALNALDPP